MEIWIPQCSSGFSRGISSFLWFSREWFCVKFGSVPDLVVCVGPSWVLGAEEGRRRGRPAGTARRGGLVSCNFSADRYHTVPLGESVELAGSVCPRAPRASLS